MERERQGDKYVHSLSEFRTINRKKYESLFLYDVFICVAVVGS